MFFSRIRCFATLIAAASLSVPGTMVTAASAQTAQSENSSRSDRAVQFASALTESANAAFSDKSVSESEQLAMFRDVLNEGLAVETIGKFVLGDARRDMSDDQTARYNAIFPQYITGLYADQFQGILGKPLELIDAKSIGTRDVIVRTQFKRTDSSPINVDWRIRRLRSGDQKAIDIIVSGVSIMLVKREEFSAFIATNGVDALIQRLETEAGV